MKPIIRDEKTGIMYREWKAASPKAALLLVHGLGASSERWDFMGEYFAANSVSCYALELKGFGGADGRRGDISSFGVYERDITSLLEIIRRDNSGIKVFLAGESMGALLSFMMIASVSRAFDGLICISPAFASRLKFSLPAYVMMAFAYIFRPGRYFLMPFDPEMCTRDREYSKTMDVGHSGNRLVTARMLAHILFAQIRAPFAARAVNAGVLFVVAGHDSIVDPAASKRVFENIGSADKTILLYPEMYHALSVELGREKVFADILGWINKRI